MVHRKPNRNLGARIESPIESPDKRSTSHQPQNSRIKERGDSDLMSKIKKPSSPPIKSSDRPPNFMKPTSSSHARKDRIQVPPPPPVTNTTDKSHRRPWISSTSRTPSTILVGSGPKPVRSLVRNSSLKPVRPSVKKSSSIRRATSSSTRTSKPPSGFLVSSGLRLARSFTRNSSLRPVRSSTKKSSVVQRATSSPTHTLKPPSGFLVSSGFKLPRSLTRNSSMRPVRSSTKKISVVQRATCSSTLKDKKHLKALDLKDGETEDDGASITKVCPCAYCSLNGHTNEALPPLKSFLSARRGEVKAQNSMKLKRLSSLMAIRRIPSGLWMNPLFEDDGRDFSEVCAKPKEELIQLGDCDEGCTEVVRDELSMNPKQEPSLDLSNEELDVLTNFLKFVENDWQLKAKEEEEKNLLPLLENYTDLASECFMMNGFSTETEGLADDEAVFWNPFEAIELNWEEESVSYPLYETDNSEQFNFEFDPVFNHFLKIDDAVGGAELKENANEFKTRIKEHIELKGIEARKTCDDTKDPNLDSEIFSVDDESEHMYRINGSESENLEKNCIQTGITEIIDEGEKIIKFSTMRRKISEDFKIMRGFNPRKPRFLSVETDPEAEKVALRHQLADDRKETEEWMIDFALRKAIGKLAEARKKRVELLVEAFETIGPICICEKPFQPKEGIDRARTMQARS